MESILRQALGEDPVVFLRGPRQSGKTTLARSLDGRRAYHTLDNLASLSAAMSDPRAFIQSFGGPVVVDEIQRVPELLLAIKESVDLDRSAGRFLLTGSAAIRGTGAVAESLAGRVRMLDLQPLSQAEIHGGGTGLIPLLFAGCAGWRPSRALSRQGLIDCMLRGGFPEAVARPSVESARRWLRGYADALVQRDMAELSRLADVTDVARLLTLMASRTASLTNHADFARVLGIPLTTLRRYQSLVESVFFAFELPAWAGSATGRLVRQPKCHLCDTGLAAMLSGISPARPEANPILLGGLFETFVVTEIRKAATASGESWRLSHFRSHAGREVDLVLEADDGGLCAFEAKLGATVRAADFDGIRHFQQIAKDRFRHGYVVHGGDDFLSFAPNLHALPAAFLQGI